MSRSPRSWCPTYFPLFSNAALREFRLAGKLGDAQLTVTAVFLAGLLASWLLCRAARGGVVLSTAILTAYGLRTALAILLFSVSAYQLPVFQDLQLGQGFWAFAPDSRTYHLHAVEIVDALQAGTEIPQLYDTSGAPVPGPRDFFLFTAFLYRVLGAHPLYVPLLNAAFWSAVAILAYSLARRLNGHEGGLIAALLVSFWPSTYIWSSQLLRDSLVILLLLSAFALFARFWNERRRRAVAALVALVLVAFVLARLRFYVELIFTIAIGGAVLAAACRRQGAQVARGCIVTALLVGVFVLARSVDPISFFSPPRSNIGDSIDAGRPLEAGTDFLADILTLDQLTRRDDIQRLGLDSFRYIVAFVPRGVARAMFAPLPWDWLSPPGDTGLFRKLAGIEIVLLIALTPFLAVGLVNAARSVNSEAWLFVAYVIVAATALGIAVTIDGTLFRLRLQFIVPMFILLGAYAPTALMDALRRLLPHAQSAHS